MYDKSAPIIILGAGAWGLSTAYHLQQQGHTNITVFDRADAIPSQYSAAWDLNKIVRAEYEDPFYTELALEAIKAWKTPLWGPYYHETGYIVATTDKAPAKAKKHLEEALGSIAAHPVFSQHITKLNSPNDFREKAWQFAGPLIGFTGYFNRLAGYAHSADAMYGIWTYLAAQGVKFILGEEQGKVTDLLYTGSGPCRTCTGIRTADKRTHTASKTIIALGAWVANILPEISHSIVARSWSVAHIQLTKQECDYLRFLPTTNIRDLGFFFEPDPETRLFKLCPLGAGFTNRTNRTATGSNTLVSIPPSEIPIPPQDFIPYSDELKLRHLLHQTLPWLSDRPFVQKKICWFADTHDSDYCIDFVPNTNNSLVVLSGDSGHGFKMMPIFGKWVVELLGAGVQKEQRWQWRKHGEASEVWGDEVSWRIGTARELSELVKEKERIERAKL